MKLNKIKACCLNSKRFNLVDGPEGVQWFTDDRNLWLCVGIHVDRRDLPELFGLSDKQVEKCLFLCEREEGDAYAINMGEAELTLTYCGDVWEYEQRLLAFKGDNGMLFVPRAFAEPVRVTDETYFSIRYHETADGKPAPMVAVYNGMICEALLKPISDAYAAYIVNRFKTLGALKPWDDGKEAKEDVETVVKEAG